MNLLLNRSIVIAKSLSNIILWVVVTRVQKFLFQMHLLHRNLMTALLIWKSILSSRVSILRHLIILEIHLLRLLIINPNLVRCSIRVVLIVF